MTGDGKHRDGYRYQAFAAAELLVWTLTALLQGALVTCEPKARRYRLLHCAAPHHL